MKVLNWIFLKPNSSWINFVWIDNIQRMIERKKSEQKMNTKKKHNFVHNVQNEKK